MKVWMNKHAALMEWWWQWHSTGMMVTVTFSWNDGDSDIQLESHCIVSYFLVKLRNDEWRVIHHGYCQNVLQHNRNMSLWLSNKSAVAHSSKKRTPPQNSKSKPCHFTWHPHSLLPHVLPTYLINLSKTKCRPLYLEAQFILRCKHFSSRL
jgi:hypothetical protein